MWYRALVIRQSILLFKCYLPRRDLARALYVGISWRTVTMISATFFPKSVLSPLLHKTVTLPELAWPKGNQAESSGLQNHRRMSYWWRPSSGILLVFSHCCIFLNRCQQRSTYLRLCSVELLGASLALLSLLHQRAPSWLNEKCTTTQSRWLAFCVKTQAGKQSCPFTPDELRYIWKSSEIQVSSWIRLSKGLCSFFRLNPGMFLGAESIHKTRLVCSCLPTCLPLPCFAQVLWDNRTSLSAHCEHTNYVLCSHRVFRRI